MEEVGRCPTSVLSSRHALAPLRHVVVHKAPWTALPSGSPSTNVRKGPV